MKREFPERPIRVLFGSGRDATNDKVAKLARLVSEAEHEHVVISDSDVRVRPDYLRSVVAPLADPKIGAVTCFYLSIDERSFVDRLQSVGMMSDFYAGIVVAWQLDGVKFALGPTIATTRERLAAFGGYESIENRPADDLLVGRLIADQGYEVELSRYPVETVADYQSVRELIHKRLRWIVVMRHMRPWGHFGLLFTHGLPWSLAAVAVHPSLAVAAVYLGGYFAVRCAITAHDRRLGPEAALLLAEDGPHPAVGRGGIFDLGGQFRAAQHPLARQRLLHSRRGSGAGEFGAPSSPEAALYRPSSTTPPSTNSVPAARRAPIRSFSRIFASAVSKMKLAAEAGTAKLSGADCTSAINAKNENARHTMESSR